MIGSLVIAHTRYVVTPTPLARKVRRLYTGQEVYATARRSLVASGFSRKNSGRSSA